MLRLIEGLSDLLPEIDGHGFIWHHRTSFEFMVLCFPTHRHEGRKQIVFSVVTVMTSGFSNRQPFLMIISLENEEYVMFK